ncbi:type IV pilus modification PilV family protein [Caldanaerobacter subterraneus]|uniref:Prepilin-type N-terminal cleavage/methylation domain-containing protein n=1 Tax=Caldanaerobacter subterraneus TaxID=911092 RepID=A0A7Y2L6Q0_9THEO|nr:prepilin-type N-terminal cleavage/methylation domain-containing protein [Caldanaerobacter subterraneus]NNG66798.1 prepilin-type N-terminal cleavage/methylation domain-containing protein [Caldanaerobacter subterraneus]
MKILKDKRGMTLIEVLVSIAMFAVVAIPLLGIFSQSVITSADSKIKTKEATIAQIIAENIKAGNVSSLDEIMTKYKEEGFIAYVEQQTSTGELSQYQIKVGKIGSNTPMYTLYIMAPKTEMTSNVPGGMPSEEDQSRDSSSNDVIKHVVALITIVIIAIWTALFLGFVVVTLGWNEITKTKILTIADTIVNMIKNGVTSLKAIGTKASEIAGVKVPWWLKWW